MLAYEIDSQVVISNFKGTSVRMKLLRSVMYKMFDSTCDGYVIACINEDKETEINDSRMFVLTILLLYDDFCHLFVFIMDIINV